MGSAALDEKHGPSAQRVLLSAGRRSARARHDVQPLVGSSMPVVRTALAIAGRDDHRRDLRSCVSERDGEAFAESEMLSWHVVPRVAYCVPSRLVMVACVWLQCVAGSSIRV